MDCIFCKIAQKEIKSDLVYEDDDMVAFKDISPQAKIHILIIPKKHIATLNDISSQDLPLVGKLFSVLQKLVQQFQIDKSGYRSVINCNQEGGQTVFHLHLHLLGGEQLGGNMVG